ncbi:hypothetical protein [Gaetbulibacter aestuarii]|uniref:Uncharacterized protein n=1 Tax=Gaetbulibacter aestuarii TaxID=1502358 RepID=A0ABW7MZU5_9FLAO
MKNFKRVCHKGELKSRLNGLAEDYLNELIYKAIKMFRGYSTEKAKKTRLLTKKEAKFVMVEVGELEHGE